MSNTTKKINEILGLEILPEYNDASGKYQMFDSGGCEIQTGEFLYGFIRLLQPEKIMETGLYSAITTMYMADALRDNGHGHIDTIEYELSHVDRSSKRLEKMGLSDFVTIHNMSSLDYKTDKQYDFILYDTEPNIRYSELEKFYYNLKDGGYCAIHDLHRGMSQGNINPDHPEIKSWPYGDIPKRMEMWLKMGDLVKFHFETPRGFTFMYKRHPEDFVC